MANIMISNGYVLTKNGNIVMNNSAPTLPVAGAVAWYDAADLATITEHQEYPGSVVEWADKSGNGLSATKTSGKLPTVTLNTLNGKPVLNFVQDIYQYKGSFNVPVGCVPAGNTSYTIFSVFQQGSGGGSIMYCGEQQTNRALYFDAFEYLQLRQEWCGNDFRSHTLSLNTPHMATYQYDGAQRLTRLDESELTAPASGKNTSTAACYIGLGGDYASMNGYIAELIVYHTALTSADIAKNEAYLKSKWGLA